MPEAAAFTGDTVPLGEAGTGAAYLLPQSQAIQQASDYIDQAQQAKAAAAAAKQKQAQDLAAQMQKDRLNIKGGILWQPEINKTVSDVTNEGRDLMKANINPNQYYNNPAIQARVDAYNQHKQNALQMADARDAYTKQAEQYDKMIAEDDGNLDPDSIQAYHNFFQTSLADHMKNGDVMPTPQKAISLEKQMKDYITPKSTTTKSVHNGFATEDVVPDSAGNRTQFRAMVGYDPITRKYISQKIGMDPLQLNAISDKNDLPGILQDVDQNLRSPNGIKFLAANGINSYGSYQTPSGEQVADDGTINAADSGDNLGQFVENPKYTALKNQIAQQNFNAKQAYQQIEDGAVNSLNSKVPTTHDRKPDYTVWDHANKVREANQSSTEFGWKQEDRNNSDVVYNQPATATNPQQIGVPGVVAKATLPAMLPSSGKTFQANPAEVWNPVTGHYGTNTTGSFKFEAGSPAYTPVIEVTDNKGNTYKQFVNDAQIKAIKSGTFKLGNTPITTANLHYPLMVSGTKIDQVPEYEPGPNGANGLPTKIPTGKFQEKQTPVVIDANSVKNDLYDKKINDDAIEVKMPADVQQRILADKIKQRYPDISDDDLVKAVNYAYQTRLQQFKSQ